jgi:hypothetical protein
MRADKDRADQDDATFQLRGQSFWLPTLAWGLNDDDLGQRLVAGFATGDAVRHGRDCVLLDSLEPGAVDLGLVRSGRAPLLVDHIRSWDCFLGALADAWVEHGALAFVGRLAEGGEADRVWSLLRQGFPLSVSLGSRVVAAEALGPEPDGVGRRYRVTRWELTEASVVVFGADPAAHLRSLERSPEARERLARQAEAAAADARLRVRQALHLDRWTAWATGAGLALAAELGAAPDRVCDLLDEQVRRHAERLQDELAA